MDMTLMDWLNTYTFPHENSFKDVEHAEKIYSSVSSMNKEIIQIQRGGHVIPKDAGRKQLFEEIDKWLAKRQK